MRPGKQQRSIQRQLRSQWLASLLLITLPLLWIADTGVRHVSANYIISRLDHDIDTLISGLSLNQETGEFMVNGDLTGGLYERTYSGHYYGIYDDDELILNSRSLWDQPAPDIRTRLGNTSNHWVGNGMRGQEWLNLIRKAQVNNQTLTIWVAEDITPLHNQLMTYRISALGGLLIALAVVALLQREVIKRAFRSLAPLQRQLRELRLGQRKQLSTAAHPTEIAPLAEEIDRLLALMEERSSRSRNAIGNLAHEMKHPLQQLQVLSETRLKDQPERRDVDGAINQLQTLVQRELKRARIIGTATPGRYFTPADDLPPLTDVLHQIYPASQISLYYPEEAILPYDRDDMLELTGNLLDNACKYGHGEITCTLTHTSDQWKICIADNGSGIPLHRMESLTARGTRLDESGKEGSGLGLSIVRAIVDSYQGSLQLSDSSTGGLTVTVQLPDADDH